MVTTLRAVSAVNHRPRSGQKSAALAANAIATAEKSTPTRGKKMCRRDGDENACKET